MAREWEQLGRSHFLKRGIQGQLDDIFKGEADPGLSRHLVQDASDLCILPVQNTHQLIRMASRHPSGGFLVSSDAAKADIAT